MPSIQLSFLPPPCSATLSASSVLPPHPPPPVSHHGPTTTFTGEQLTWLRAHSSQWHNITRKEETSKSMVQYHYRPILFDILSFGPKDTGCEHSFVWSVYWNSYWLDYRGYSIVTTTISKIPIALPISLSAKPPCKVSTSHWLRCTHASLYCQNGTSLHNKIFSAWQLYQSGDKDAVEEYQPPLPPNCSPNIAFIIFQQAVLWDKASRATKDKLEMLQDMVGEGS